MTKPELDKSNHFMKRFRCTKCSCNFETPILKSRALSALKREPDFFVRYGGLVPWLYEIAVCPNCAYSAEIRLWDAIAISDTGKLNFALDRIRPKGVNEYCGARTFEMGILSVQLAMATYGFCNVKYYDKANLALRGSYLARTVYELAEANQRKTAGGISVPSVPEPDATAVSGAMSQLAGIDSYQRETVSPRALEQSFKKVALDLFIRSYETEKVENTRFGTAGIMYIIGELKRQSGELVAAVNWFSRAVQQPDCPQQITRLARDQWDLAREQYRRETENAT